MNSENEVCCPFTQEEMLEAAKSFGTAGYIYHLPFVRQQYQQLFEAFDYPKLRVLYAMKANSHPALLKELRTLGSGVDAVSVGEVQRALEVGFAPEQIMYTTNAASSEEFRFVAREGILINVDGMDSLKRLAAMNIEAELCLRFRPPVKAGSHSFLETGGDESKFGFEDSELSEALSIIEDSSLRLVGLHKHTGSGIYAVDDFREAAEFLFALLDPGLMPDLRFVDLGGGFGVRYKQSGAAFDLQSFAAYCSERMKEISESFGRELELVFEPGKYLVAEAGVLLTQVLSRKENSASPLLICDSGFHHLIRPMLYEAHHEIVNLSAEANRPLEQQTICGRVCESGDVFAKDRSLPRVEVGDYLAILTAGAYGFTMASNYNLHKLPYEASFDAGAWSSA